MNNCSDIIVSEDVHDYIIGYSAVGCPVPQDNDEYCVKSINENWCLAYAPGSENQQFSISDIGYITIPKLYGLMDTSSFDVSGITDILNQPLLDLRGQGVIIGFVDTGIDYTLDIFNAAPGLTRIGTIWDQTVKSNGRQVYNIFEYGTVYTKDDINRALSAKRSGGDPYEIVPSKDTDGHGTFMAGVAAASETAEYTGAAPECEIAMVKLKEAKKYLRDYFLIKDGAKAYQENDMMTAVRFLYNYSRQQKKPLVICIGLGTCFGPRNGATPFADVLDTMSRQLNTVVITCMGNEATQRAHKSGVVLRQEEPGEMEINVGNNEKGFTMEIWVDSRDVLSVSVISPSGETIPRVPARTGMSTVYNFLFENTTVTIDYRILEIVSGYEVIILRFISPAAGIWRIRLFSLTNIIGSYNAWLPLRQFMNSDTYFLQSDPDTTLVEPSAADKVISVGAYDHKTGAAYADSGRGYTTDSRVKPDFAAPGLNVYGPRPGGGYTNKSGTSIAAAHAAGAAALLLTWGVYYGNDPYMSASEIKSALIRGAQRNSDFQYPNRILGYGKLDLAEAFLILRTT